MTLGRSKFKYNWLKLYYVSKEKLKEKKGNQI